MAVAAHKEMRASLFVTYKWRRNPYALLANNRHLATHV